jgi:hypothetical protein
VDVFLRTTWTISPEYAIVAAKRELLDRKLKEAGKPPRK